MLPPEKSASVKFGPNQSNLLKPNSRNRLLTCPTTIWGTKNPSRRFNHLNSATQTFVNSRLVYSNRAGCQRLFFAFLPGLRARNVIQLTCFEAVVKSFFDLFFTAQLSHSQRTWARLYLKPESAQEFFSSFLRLFSTPPASWGLLRDRGTRSMGSDRGVRPGSRHWNRMKRPFGAWTSIRL